jgi:hypothetical protein
VCIGKRNYKYSCDLHRLFVSFVSMTMLLTLYSVAVTIYEFVSSYKDSFVATLANNILVVIVFVVALWFFVTLLVLCSYHVRILTKGLTTNEDLKEIYETLPHKQPFKKASTLKRPHSIPFQKQTYVFKSLSRDSGMSSLQRARTIEL